jgi:hypothetical protein
MLKSSSPLSKRRKKLRGQAFGRDSGALTEQRMVIAEARFSELGAKASRQAHDYALETRGTVVKLVGANIVKVSKDGRQTILESIPPRAVIGKGTRLSRRVMPQV